MKRFLIRCGMGFLVLFALLLTVNYIYVHTEYYVGLNGMDKYRHVPEHLDVVSFGASHSAECYDWTLAGLPAGTVAMELSSGGQTLVQDAYILDYFQDRIDSDTTVIIDVMANSLYGSESEDSQARFYQVFPRGYIYGWNIIDAIRYAYIPILGNRADGLDAIWQKLMYREDKNGDQYATVIAEVNGDIAEDTDALLDGEPTDIIDGWTLEEMITEGQRRATVKEEEAPLGDKSDEYQALIKMLDICRERGAGVIVTTVPTTPYFYEGFSEGYIETVHDDIQELCDSYGVPYVDYTGDERFLGDYRIWFDTDHMNSLGTRYFMPIFMRENEQYFRCLQ